MEVSFILLATTFASSLGSEIFGVRPERKDIAGFWKRNWKRLSPEQKRNWKGVFRENRKGLFLLIVIIVVLLLFGAWFEVFVG